jgi:hypothetical protein
LLRRFVHDFVPPRLHFIQTLEFGCDNAGAALHERRKESVMLQLPFTEHWQETPTPAAISASVTAGRHWSSLSASLSVATYKLRVLPAAASFVADYREAVAHLESVIWPRRSHDAEGGLEEDLGAKQPKSLVDTQMKIDLDARLYRGLVVFQNDPGKESSLVSQIVLALPQVSLTSHVATEASATGSDGHHAQTFDVRFEEGRVTYLYALETAGVTDAEPHTTPREMAHWDKSHLSCTLRSNGVDIGGVIGDIVFTLCTTGSRCLETIVQDFVRHYRAALVGDLGGGCQRGHQRNQDILRLAAMLRGHRRKDSGAQALASPSNAPGGLLLSRLLFYCSGALSCQAVRCTVKDDLNVRGPEIGGALEFEATGLRLSLSMAEGVDLSLRAMSSEWATQDFGGSSAPTTFSLLGCKEMAHRGRQHALWLSFNEQRAAEGIFGMFLAPVRATLWGPALAACMSAIEGVTRALGAFLSPYSSHTRPQPAPNAPHAAFLPLLDIELQSIDIAMPLDTCFGVAGNEDQDDSENNMWLLNIVGVTASSSPVGETGHRAPDQLRIAHLRLATGHYKTWSACEEMQAAHSPGNPARHWNRADTANWLTLPGTAPVLLPFSIQGTLTRPVASQAEATNDAVDAGETAWRITVSAERKLEAFVSDRQVGTAVGLALQWTRDLQYHAEHDASTSSEAIFSPAETDMSPVFSATAQDGPRARRHRRTASTVSAQSAQSSVVPQLAPQFAASLSLPGVSVTVYAIASEPMKAAKSECKRSNAVPPAGKVGGRLAQTLGPAPLPAQSQFAEPLLRLTLQQPKCWLSLKDESLSYKLALSGLHLHCPLFEQRGEHVAGPQVSRDPKELQQDSLWQQALVQLVGHEAEGAAIVNVVHALPSSAVTVTVSLPGRPRVLLESGAMCRVTHVAVERVEAFVCRGRRIPPTTADIAGVSQKQFLDSVRGCSLALELPKGLGLCLASRLQQSNIELVCHTFTLCAEASSVSEDGHPLGGGPPSIKAEVHFEEVVVTGRHRTCQLGILELRSGVLGYDVYEDSEQLSAHPRGSIVLHFQPLVVSERRASGGKMRVKPPRRLL